MGRRKLSPSIHSLLLQLHLSQRNTNSAINESTKDTSSSSSSNEATHNKIMDVHSTAHHHNHHLHVFTWPSLKRRPSSSSLTSHSTEDEHDTDPDTDHETDSQIARNAFINSHDHQLSGHKSVVSFGNCEVRSYTQVLGDHPCCSEGCPIQLGWSYTREESMKVDDYERCYHTVQGDLKLQKHTVLQDLRLSPEERRSILILSKQQEHAIADNLSVDSNSSHNDDNESNIDTHSALPAEQTTSATCERELSRECRRLNRCGGWNVNIKASRRRNKRNQEAFFGAPTRTTSRRIPADKTATALL